MEQTTHSQKFLRQRKFFMVLPLLVLPFITLIFWALGGGKVNGANSKQAHKGFNMDLPDANLEEDKRLDKMTFYDRAAQDSVKRKELIKNDPYYNNGTDSNRDNEKVNGNAASLTTHNDNGINVGMKTSINSDTYTDNNEEKVYRKLEELNKVLKNAPVDEIKEKDKPFFGNQKNTSVNTADIDRLEQMMQSMQSSEGDPEMQQINGMLEKILDIQHPDRVQEKLRQASEARKDEVFVVSEVDSNPVTLLGNRTQTQIENNSNRNSENLSNSFYSIDDNAANVAAQNALEAVIHETQTVMNGSTVKLRLLNDIFINGILIPKDHFIFGIASLNVERLTIVINSIRFENSLFPVALSVHDMDGLDGIYIPGSISRDAAKETSNQALQNMGITSIDPSIGAQAANVGIEAARGLFNKKSKLVKVTVKAGYKVLLRDKKQGQSG